MPTQPHRNHCPARPVANRHAGRRRSRGAGRAVATVAGEHLALEIADLGGAVQLKMWSRRAKAAVRARVQPRRQDDHLLRPAAAARRKYWSKYLRGHFWKLTKCSPKSVPSTCGREASSSSTSPTNRRRARQNASAYKVDDQRVGMASSARAAADKQRGRTDTARCPSYHLRYAPTDLTRLAQPRSPGPPSQAHPGPDPTNLTPLASLARRRNHRQPAWSSRPRRQPPSCGRPGKPRCPAPDPSHRGCD